MKGQELDVDVSGTKLFISTDSHPEVERFVLEFDKTEKYIRRPLSILYKLGYDEIQINFKDPKILSQVQEQTEALLGFEIVHQTPNSCLVKNVASPLDTEFESVMRRVFLVLISMGNEFVDAVEKGKLDILKDIAQLEKTNNKLTFFCERLLNKHGYKEERKKTFVYNLISHLEYIADHLGNICFYLSTRPKIKLSPTTLKIARDIVMLIDKYYELYYKFEFIKFGPLKDKQELVEKQCKQMFEKKVSGSELRVVHSLYSIVFHLHHMTESMA